MIPTESCTTHAYKSRAFDLLGAAMVTWDDKVTKLSMSDRQEYERFLSDVCQRCARLMTTALHFVLAARRTNSRSFPVCPVNLEVDIHPVKRISSDGVLIGCTFIPWGEVDRLQSLLAATA